MAALGDRVDRIDLRRLGPSVRYLATRGSMRQLEAAILKALAKRAHEKWPIIKLALLHRVGRVEVGQPSVIVAVATPHRADAFEACRHGIEQFKHDAPIWKKESLTTGESEWVMGS